MTKNGRPPVEPLYALSNPIRFHSDKSFRMNTPVMSQSDLLVNLLDYVVEQSKETDPASFKLSGTKEFLRFRPSLVGLPGVDFDKKVEGDHIWMRVDRLKATPPPPVQPKELSRFISVSNSPLGQEPTLNECALNHSITAETQDLTK